MKEKQNYIENTNKHNQQKNAIKMKRDTNHAAKHYCRICKNIISPLFQCSCLGESNSNNYENNNLASAPRDVPQKQNISHQISDHQMSASQVADKDADFQNNTLMVLALINDLVKRKLLTIEDNSALCTLTIKCDPKKLTELQKNAVTAFVEMLKKELSDFLDKHAVSDETCIDKKENDIQGYILTFSINIPNAKLYHQFIENLKEKKLLPPQEIASQDTQKNNNSSDKLFNPFRTELKP